MTRVLRSLIHPATVAGLVAGSYGLTVTGCTLIRSLVNEVYEISTPDRRYVLKLYQAGGWSAEEVAWEVEFVDHVSGRGVDVARAVHLADGEPAGVLETPEGPRPFALSEFVAGTKPRPPFDDALYHGFGRLLAGFHPAGDDFGTGRYRREFGLTLTLDEPLEQLLPALADRPEEQAVARELGGVARDRLTALAAGGMDWGVRHGDISLDNLHRTAVDGNEERGATTGRLTLHDFDLTAPGWRAADLTGCLATPFADAFRAGYTEVRELRPADLDALPWLRVLEIIDNLRFHLVEKPARRGTESVADGWAEDRLSALRAAAAGLLSS